MDRLKKDLFLILIGVTGVAIVAVWALGSF